MEQCLQVAIREGLPVDAQQAPNFIHFDFPYIYRWEYGEENLLKESVAALERMIAYEGRLILLLFYWKVNQVHPVVCNILMVI